MSAEGRLGPGKLRRVGPRGGEGARWLPAVGLSLLIHASVAMLPGDALVGGAVKPESAAPVFEVSLAPPREEPPGTVEPRPREEVGRAVAPELPVPGPTAGTPTAPAALPTPAADSQGTPGGPTAGAPAGGPGDAGAAGAGEGPAHFLPPRLLAGALPIDPADVDAIDIPAEIPVRLRVGPDGAVREIVPEVVGLGAPVLEALRRSAEAMRFAPARLDGEPVEAWFRMTFVHRR